MSAAAAKRSPFFNFANSRGLPLFRFANWRPDLQTLLINVIGRTGWLADLIAKTKKSLLQQQARSSAAATAAGNNQVEDIFQQQQQKKKP